MLTPPKANGLIAAALLMSLGFGGSAAEAANNVTCNGCVGTADIAKDAVTSSKIKKNTIRAKDLHKTAKPAGADYSQTIDDTMLSPNNTSIVLLSVKVNAPGSGTIIGTGSGTAYFGLGDGSFVCSVTTEKVIGTNFVRVNEASSYSPFSRTTAFPVDSAGKVTVNLVCYVLNGEVTIYNPNLVAWFVPGKY